MGISTTPPSGFRDFGPQAAALRARAQEAISRVYRSFGFSRITTSGVEDLEVLLGKGGGENEKLIFKILKRGEKLELAQGSSDLADLGLRFDLTLPLSRFYAKHQGELPHPFKAFQIGSVWRAERAQKGRYREFLQCDVDVLGSEHPQNEVEVISAMSAALGELGVRETTVVINDRRLLSAALDEAGVPPEKRGAACVLLDKLDKMERSAVLAELELALGKDSADRLEKSVLAEGADLEAFSRAAPEPGKALERILALLRECGDGSTKFQFSTSLVRGFDYYTGPVFEFRHPGLAGSLGGGGRYDGLVSQFGGPKVPACGGSIGFERLMLLLEAAPGAEGGEGPDACVIVFAEELRAQCLALAAKLRREGLSVDVFPGQAKLKAQFKYADATRARYALIIGPDEAAAHKVKIKDLKTGEERLSGAEELAEALRKK